MSATAEAKLELEAKLKEFVGKETGPPQHGRDAVNEPMIRHWCDAMQDANPIYTDVDAAKQSAHGGIVAPPTMMQAWILPGIEMAGEMTEKAYADKQNQLHALLTESGYPSVVATNCEQEYTRYLKPGDEVSATTVIESISEEKATALGIGYFIDTRTIFRDQDGEEVGWMTFRVLKFKPNAPQEMPTTESGAPAAPRRLRPAKGHDNAWWWDGVDRGELLIQKCSSCGVLRHPPRPMCGECQSTDWEVIMSAGSGTVHSFVVMHHPQVPGYEYPLVAALIDLDEGTRFLSNVIDCEPSDVHIGMRVQASIEQVDEEMKLPLFRPAS